MSAAIIVAAGSSRRMGFDKLTAPLFDKPVLQHTVEAFLNSPVIEEVVVVTTEERFSALDFSEFDKPVRRVDGGADRHNSVSNGLAAITTDAHFVAVHDGARPLITTDQISLTLQHAQKHGAATSARRVTETVKRATLDGFVKEAVCREDLWLMETPQIFSRELLEKAYAEVEAKGQLVTDEVSALELIGVPTYLVENPSPNIKITFPQDLSLAEKLRDDLSA